MARRIVKAFATVVVWALFSTLPVQAQRTLSVTAPDGTTTSVELDGLVRRSIVTSDRGLKTTFDGVALRDVLAKVGVELGEALKGKALSRVIIASAPDGYQVTYAIAEVDAGFTDQVILLADQRDGRPLLPDTGPLQIVVPLDKRPARWVRQVTRLEVRDVK